MTSSWSFVFTYVITCYVVVWQHVIGMVCILFAVLSASPTQPSEQYKYHTGIPLLMDIKIL